MTGQGDGQQGEPDHEWGKAVPASSVRPSPGDIIIDRPGDGPESPGRPGRVDPARRGRAGAHHPGGAAVGHEGAPAHPVAPPAGPRATRTHPRVPGGRRLHPLLHRRRAAARHDRPAGRRVAQRLRVHASRPDLPSALRGTPGRGRAAGQLFRHGHRGATLRGRRRGGHPFSNVFDVAVYESIADVPEDYRPGSPFHHFRQELEITAYS